MANQLRGNLRLELGYFRVSTDLGASLASGDADWFYMRARANVAHYTSLRLYIDACRRGRANGISIPSWGNYLYLTIAP